MSEGGTMPFYYQIPKSPDGRRTARGLLDLKAQFREEVPTRTREETLLLATWNIREFDSAAYGVRLDESMHYIAEIVSHFDLVAVQEVREDLTALTRLNELLGGWWDYLVTDVTAGKPGNRERMAFIYDSRKVNFGGLAGEVVLPPSKVKGPDGKTTYLPTDQFYRTPFIAGFQVGWFKFMLGTVHIVYGKSKAESPERVKEIQNFCKFLAGRVTEESTWSENLILLGDFNIFKPSDITFKAITDAGFEVPERLQELPANASKNKHYDQIAFWSGNESKVELLNAGVFDFYKSVFSEEHEDICVKEMGDRYTHTKKGKEKTPGQQRQYYRTYWRTHQMSDHLPMWVELKVDFGDGYLKGKARRV